MNFRQFLESNNEDHFIESVFFSWPDTTPALIYADWLEERNDPLAHFIQIAITTGWPDWRQAHQARNTAFPNTGDWVFPYTVNHYPDCIAWAWPNNGPHITFITKPLNVSPQGDIAYTAKPGQYIMARHIQGSSRIRFLGSTLSDVESTDRTLLVTQPHSIHEPTTRDKREMLATLILTFRKRNT